MNKALNFYLALIALSVAPCWSSPTKNAVKLVDPFEEGPYSVNSTQYLQLVNPIWDLDTNLNVYAPNEPGNFPVLYFVTGFGGLAPGFTYSMMLNRVASHGFVAVGIWKEESPANSFNESWFDKTVAFVENDLETSLHLSGFNLRMHVDYLNSFVSGHSAGAHVPVVQLNAHCLNFVGQILLSPVDGADPIGLNPVVAITPGEKVNYTIPTLQIVTGFDPVISETTGGACAPEELSNRRFVDAMNGPVWYINATANGHADILDPFFENINEIINFCATNPELDKVPYINYVAGAIVSFMKGAVDPILDCDYFDYLTTTGNLGVDTLNEFTDNGWVKCRPLGCSLAAKAN